MRTILAVVLLLLLSGCVSTHMKQYMGMDIREVILDSGPPLNAMDMGGGVRAFQFRWAVEPTACRAPQQHKELLRHMVIVLGFLQVQSRLVVALSIVKGV